MTEFQAQNAGNGIPGLQIANIFRGGGYMPLRGIGIIYDWNKARSAPAIPTVIRVKFPRPISNIFLPYFKHRKVQRTYR